MKEVSKALKKARKELARKVLALPDEDAYAQPYSVLMDLINEIDRCLKDIGPALKDAKAERKRNPNQFPNRARKWVGKP